MSFSIAWVFLATTFVGCLADVCYTGQEFQRGGTSRQRGELSRWILKSPGGDQCSCTDTRLGGVSIMPQPASTAATSLVLGDNIQRCSAGSRMEEATAVSMVTCGTRELVVQSRVATVFFPTELNDNEEWKLSFRILPGEGAQQISKEIIHLSLSSVPTNDRYKIELSSNAVELKTNLGQQAARKSWPSSIAWGTEAHTLIIGNGRFEFDSTPIPPQLPFSGPTVSGVQFIRFFSDSANGARWNIDNIPCSWLQLSK